MGYLWFFEVNNRKHKLYSNYVKTPTGAINKKYVEYTNILVRTLRLAKKIYYNGLLQQVKGDIKKHGHTLMNC